MKISVWEKADGQVRGEWKILGDGGGQPLVEAPDAHPSPAGWPRRAQVHLVDVDVPVGSILGRFDRTPRRGFEMVRVFRVARDLSNAEPYREWLFDLTTFEAAESLAKVLCPNGGQNISG